MTRLIIIFAIAMFAFTSCGDKAQPSENKNTDTAIQTSNKTKTEADTEVEDEVEDDVEPEVVTSFNDLDIKPRFGGCDEVTDPAELKSCSDKKLSKFISTNLQYPENARKLKIEGKAVVSFVIEPNGSISDIAALSNLGGGLEEEAIRVFELMNERKQWWVAGMKDGKRQRVKLQLPITFKM